MMEKNAMKMKTQLVTNLSKGLCCRLTGLKIETSYARHKYDGEKCDENEDTVSN